MKRKDKAQDAEETVVLLQDLAPRKDVKGGSAKLIFGEGGGVPDERRSGPARTTDKPQTDQRR